MLGHIYSPGYIGSIGRRIIVLRPVPSKNSRPHLKKKKKLKQIRTGGVAQVTEYLGSVRP
jgi:hypothetical protein